MALGPEGASPVCTCHGSRELHVPAGVGVQPTLVGVHDSKQIRVVQPLLHFRHHLLPLPCTAGTNQCNDGETNRSSPADLQPVESCV